MLLYCGRSNELHTVLLELAFLFYRDSSTRFTPSWKALATRCGTNSGTAAAGTSTRLSHKGSTESAGSSLKISIRLHFIQPRWAEQTPTCSARRTTQSAKTLGKVRLR